MVELAIIEHALRGARITYQPEEIGGVEMDCDRVCFTLSSKDSAYLIRMWDMSEEGGLVKIEYTLYRENRSGGAMPLYSDELTLKA